MKKKALVSQPIPERGVELLKDEGLELDLNEEKKALGREALIARLREKDGLLCLLTDGIDAGVMDAAPRLKVIANCAVGYDNIDVAAAAERGITVTNTPGVLTETTADLAWALLMAAARRIVEADAFVRAGRFDGWDISLLLGRDVHGAALGIVGAGRIGTAVAMRSRGFDMRVLYCSEEASERLETELGAEKAGLERLLRESDFVSLHVPLTPETNGMIGEKEIGMMKPTAFLINTSRGPVVDEEALVWALREKRIAGAGLDVYEREPALAPGLAELDNVVLLPHIGSASVETRSRMAEIAARNLIAVLRGQQPPNPVRAG